VKGSEQPLVLLYRTTRQLYVQVETVLAKLNVQSIGSPTAGVLIGL
jgi:hypothetical protein